MLKITDIGIILQSPEGKDFRYITFRDMDSMAETNYMVYKTNQPYLWKNIEKAEKNSAEIFTLPGKIEKYNDLDIVIFQGEAVKEAFEKQRWKLNELKIISREEAIKKITTSDGYLTDRNTDDSITIGWYPLDKKAKKIKFRYYHKADKYNVNKHSYFEWSGWFNIED